MYKSIWGYDKRARLFCPTMLLLLLNRKWSPSVTRKRTNLWSCTCASSVKPSRRPTCTSGKDLRWDPLPPGLRLSMFSCSSNITKTWKKFLSSALSSFVGWKSITLPKLQHLLSLWEVLADIDIEIKIIIVLKYIIINILGRNNSNPKIHDVCSWRAMYLL